MAIFLQMNVNFLAITLVIENLVVAKYLLHGN